MQKPDEQTEREFDARALARNEDLSSLATHLLRKMEGDRSDLAKQLHDELGGLITAAKMDMAFLSARIGPSLDAQSREKFNSVLQMLNQAMMLKRRVVESLRPSLLDHFGLGVAMRSHFDEHCRNAGIECVSTVPDEALQLDTPTQLTLFRVAQDVLDGIVARGGARNVELVIEAEGPGYAMTIGDDGPGMQTSLAKALPAAEHRVWLSGGRIESESRPGSDDGPSGNRIRVYVPRSTAVSA